MVGPDYKEPRINLGSSFANRDQPGFSNQETEVFWWRGFDDEKLNRLVDLAIAGNHDLRIATARLREARALWSETEFDPFPTITSQGSYSRERQSKVRGGGVRDRELDLYNIGFDATWELDFFGACVVPSRRHRRTSKRRKQPDATSVSSCFRRLRGTISSCGERKTNWRSRVETPKTSVNPEPHGCCA
jgi:outer membrane protein TolC